jgi:hypothetical protein
VLYRRGTVILCKSQNTKRCEFGFRALISDGVECLELITYPLSNRML